MEKHLLEWSIQLNKMHLMLQVQFVDSRKQEQMDRLNHHLNLKNI